MQRPLVQILVVVANIQVRTLKAEVEKGFMRTAFVHELVDPKAQVNPENGMQCGIFIYLAKSLHRCVERESGLIFLNHISDIFTVT